MSNIRVSGHPDSSMLATFNPGSNSDRTGVEQWRVECLRLKKRVDELQHMNDQLQMEAETVPL
jgi:hypothetical protein